MLRLLSRLPSSFYRSAKGNRFRFRGVSSYTVQNKVKSADFVPLCYQPLSNLLVNQAHFCSSPEPLKFNEICDETLDSLAECLEELVENSPAFKSGDVSYSDGVITAALGGDFGTYVINRQTPNRQIWLSSPTSGPKRYDFVDGVWIYKHDNTTLHSLLEIELGSLLGTKLDFTNRCSYGKSEK